MKPDDYVPPDARTSGGCFGCLLPLVLILIALLVAGCATAPPGESKGGNAALFGGAPLTVWHDDENGATCWLYGDGSTVGKAISCLPDKDLTR